MTLGSRTFRRIRPISLVVVAVLGAALGTTWDLFHVRSHTTVYSIGIDRMPWWVPLEFAIVYVAGVKGIEMFGRPARDPRTYQRLGGETAFVTVVYAMTAFLHRYEWLVFLIAAGALLTRWRTFRELLPPNRLPAAALVVFGSTTEAILIAAGVFRYTHASLGNIPVWLPLLYANAFPFAVRLTEAAQDEPT